MTDFAVGELPAETFLETGTGREKARVSSPVFSPTVLSVGFLFALLLSAGCFGFSVSYLHTYLDITRWYLRYSLSLRDVEERLEEPTALALTRLCSVSPRYGAWPRT